MKIVLTSFIFMCCIMTTMRAQHQYELKKISDKSDELTLQALYSQHMKPLIIVNDIVYLPPDGCVPGRNIDYYTESKKQYAYNDSKNTQQSTDSKKIESRTEKKNVKSQTDQKDQDNSSDRKDQDSNTDVKDNEQATDTKDQDQISDKHETEQSNDKREEHSATDKRSVTWYTDKKGITQYSVCISCIRTEIGFKLFDLRPTVPIYIYDILGKREIDPTGEVDYK